MKILIDIGHPAHVHLFKNLYFELITRNYKVIITVKKNIDSAIRLLDQNNIPHIELSNKNDSILGKLITQLKVDFQLVKIIKNNKIDLMLGTSITIAHATQLTGVPSIVFDDDDDDVQPLMVKLGHPFASLVLSPDVLKNKRKKRPTLFYPSYHELAYLHPNRFKPDQSILNEIGVKIGEKYFILRFNAFKAHHDIGTQGFSYENKKQLINCLEKHGKVFITTENNIDKEFSKYQLKVSPEKAHSLIYYSAMLIGDSQTMTSEAALLGVPALRSNSFVGRLAVLEEEEHRYGLTYGFLPSNFNSLLIKINELLAKPNLNEEWKNKRNKMLPDKIDSTSFFLWMVENFPKSMKDLKKRRDFWTNFQ